MSTKTNISNHPASTRLEEPRFENGKAMLIAGLRGHYTSDSMNQLSSQWQRFMGHIGKLPQQTGQDAFGLNFLGQGEPGIEYLSGVEVSSCSGLPADFDCVSIPAQRYAVFGHRGHLSTIYETCEAIAHDWLPRSGHKAPPVREGAPDFFERYSREFNPQTGTGGIEIWVPIQ
jgi:AraC family transcriptional regulator